MRVYFDDKRLIHKKCEWNKSLLLYQTVIYVTKLLSKEFRNQIAAPCAENGFNPQYF